MKNKIKLALIFTLSLIVVSIPFSAKAVYVSNTLTSRYIYDVENDSTYDFPLSHEVEYEKKINTNNIYGKLWVNPIFTYSLENERKDINLQEAFLDIYFQDLDLRIGKQKLTWGKSDGLVVTNIVNPRDYTVNPVVNFSDQFQGVNAIKGTVYSGNTNIELVFVPEFKSAEYDTQLFKEQLPQGFKIDNSQTDIDTNLENSELFLRYSTIGESKDIEIIAAYSWDDEPTIHKDFETKKIRPEYHRLGIIGGSMSTIAGPFVLRGEVAYINGEFFNLKNSQEHLQKYPEGVVEKNEVKWLAGIDYSNEGYLFSTQLMQEVIADYEESIEQSEYNNKMTILIQKEYLRSKLNTEISFHYNFNDEVLLGKPTISYDYSDIINFTGGANLSIKGNTPKRDIIYLQTEYLF